MERIQTGNEKDAVICLIIIMFTWRVKVIKMSKNVFFAFSANDNILFNFFRKCYGLLDSKLPLARCQPFKQKVLVFFCRLGNFLMFLPSISY